MSRLVGVPFKGEKLFRAALEPLFIETKDKRKVLPSNKKESNRGKSQSFWSPGFSSRGRDFFPRGRGRGFRPKFMPRGRGQGFSRSGQNKSGKDQRTA